MNPKTRRRLSILPWLVTACLAVSVVTALLSGCGCIRRKDVSVDGSKVTMLSLAYWGSQDEVRVMEVFLNAFEKSNPDIRVKRIHIPGDSYGAKIETMIAANRAPDVFYIGMDQCTQYMRKGVIVDLAPYLSKSKTVKAEDFFPEMLRQFTLNGAVYALPKDVSPEVVFYNKDFFDQAGVAYPHDGWNWAEFVRTAQKLTVRDRHGNVLRYGAIPWDWKQWLVQNGGSLFNPSRDRCVMDSQAAIGAVQFQYDLYSKYGISPSQNNPEVESTMYFMSGKVAMVLTYRWFINMIGPLKRYQWSIGPTPRGKYDNNYSGVVGYAMSSQSRHKAAAWKLIQYLCGPEGQILVTKNHWGVPTLKKLADRTKLFEEPAHPSYNYKLFAREIKKSKMLLGSPYCSEQRFNDIANAEIGRLYLGQQTPEQACKAITNRVNAVIEYNKSAGSQNTESKQDGK